MRRAGMVARLVAPLTSSTSPNDADIVSWCEELDARVWPRGAQEDQAGKDAARALDIWGGAEQLQVKGEVEAPARTCGHMDRLHPLRTHLQSHAPSSLAGKERGLTPFRADELAAAAHPPLLQVVECDGEGEEEAGDGETVAHAGVRVRSGTAGLAVAVRAARVPGVMIISPSRVMERGTKRFAIRWECWAWKMMDGEERGAAHFQLSPYTFARTLRPIRPGADELDEARAQENHGAEDRARALVRGVYKDGEVEKRACGGNQQRARELRIDGYTARAAIKLSGGVQFGGSVASGSYSPGIIGAAFARSMEVGGCAARARARARARQWRKSADWRATAVDGKEGTDSASPPSNTHVYEHVYAVAHRGRNGVRAGEPTRRTGSEVSTRVAKASR
ncbi:hypothetical protein DFH06DRAFT_1149035 [Mycena polygramma]|nr:hypothetical protein DFH06DRAFT_1149035 [Mycena polygramma]